MNCQACAPSAMLVSRTSGSSASESRLIWVFTATGMPGCLQVARGLQRRGVGAGQPAQPIVRRRRSVDRDADALQAGGGCGLRALRRQPTAAGHHRALHAGGPDGRHDLQPIRPQVRFAADQAHLQHAQLGQLPHQVQAFGGAQLVGARPAGPRPAVPAGQVALQRHLPDGVDRAHRAIHVARLIRQRQVPPPLRRSGRQGQGRAAHQPVSSWSG